MRPAPLPADALDETDRHIINRLQDGFPISHDPFAEVAPEFGLSGPQLIARVTRLRDLGAITRFGPFLDAEAMGGAFCRAPWPCRPRISMQSRQWSMRTPRSLITMNACTG